TQWMSILISVDGSACSCCHVRVTGSSTSPKTLKSQVARSVCGTVPAWRTGHFSVRYWPGGSRAGSRPFSTSFFSKLQPKSDTPTYTNCDAERCVSPACVRPRVGSRRGGLPAANGLERRRCERALRCAAADREGTHHRAA